MENGLTGIDHAILAVPDLDRARMGWSRLGFTIGPRGRHPGLATGNYCILFERDYIELLGLADPGGDKGALVRFLAPYGLTGLAWGTADAEATHTALARNGIATPPPTALSRQIELEEDTALLRFRVFPLPEPAMPGLPSLICQHLTPDLLRRPVWTQHRNGITGLAGAVAIIADPASLIPACEQLFGAGKVTLTAHGLRVQCGGHDLRLVSPQDFAALYPEIPLPSRPPPFLAGLRLETAEPGVTADYCAQWQIAFTELPDGGLAIPPEETGGTMLEIVPKR